MEVAESHTGVNLSIVFANVLKNFGIKKKVCNSHFDQRRIGYSSVSQTCVTLADS
jgi:hypothetical protein